MSATPATYRDAGHAVRVARVRADLAAWVGVQPAWLNAAALFERATRGSGGPLEAACQHLTGNDRRGDDEYVMDDDWAAAAEAGMLLGLAIAQRTTVRSETESA